MGSIDYAEVLADLRRRDAADSSRETSPLRPAPDAVHLDSTGRYIEDVIDGICELAAQAKAAEPAGRAKAARGVPTSQTAREPEEARPARDGGPQEQDAAPERPAAEASSAVRGTAGPE